METIENTGILKKRLLDNLGRVSESDVHEISDFIEFILSRRQKRKSKKAVFAPEKDPIFRIMGSASVEPFSKCVDRELYGE